MCVSLSLGRSTPRIRGMDSLLGSTLALLVARIGANHKQASAAPDQFAVLADAFDAGSHFHGSSRSLAPAKEAIFVAIQAKTDKRQTPLGGGQAHRLNATRWRRRWHAPSAPDRPRR